MRIALMLRSLDEKGGVGIYTRFLLEHLLKMDYNNTYLLFYKNPANLGRYKHYSNVEEYYLPMKNKFLWDQVAIPRATLKHHADIVFNPKFSLPLLTTKKCIVVQHGADWFLPEYSKFYKKSDVLYNKIFIPLFCKKADVVISVSEFSKEDFIKYVNVAPEKIRTVYFGPADFFNRVSNTGELDRIRKKYDLPDKYILTLSRYGYGGGFRKNINNIFISYKHYFNNNNNPVKLVIGGKDVDKYVKDLNLEKEKYLDNIQFTGWIEQEDLPSIYTMAELYLYPSNLETFPIPLTEAMACGTPIITSDVNGLKEIAGDAALFVNNKNTDEISQAISTLLTDIELKIRLSEKGLERSKYFTWNKCTEQILEIFHSLDNYSLSNVDVKRSEMLNNK